MAALTWTHTPSGRDQWVERWAVRSSWLNVILGIGIVVSLGFMIHFANRRAVDYGIIEVDSAGDPVGKVQPIRGEGFVIDKVFRAEIKNFLRAAFTITDHVKEQEDYVQEVEAQCDQDTWDKLKAFYGEPENDPRKLMGSAWQEVKLLSVPTKLPERDTYRVKWETIKHDYMTGSITRRVWDGTMRVQPDTSVDPSPDNVFALRISGFDFTPEVKDD